MGAPFRSLLLCGMVMKIASAAPPVTSLIVSPDNDQILTGSQAGLSVRSWPELKPSSSVPTEIKHVHALAFSPSGKWLAVGGGRPAEFGHVEIYRWPSAERVSLTVDHEDVVYDVRWLDDRRLLTAAADRQVRMWEVAGEELQPLQNFSGHSRRVRSVLPIVGTDLVVSAGVDQSIRVWDATGGDLLRVLDNHTGPIHALAAPSKQTALPQVASCSEDRSVRIWQPSIGRLVRFARLPAEPLCLAWSETGDALVAGCTDGTVRWIDPLTVKVTHTAHVGKSQWVHEVVPVPHSGSWVAGLHNGNLEIIKPAK